ncbi:MAG: hypothetical protein H0U49_03640 [Parachlamydiaceae bacterium]|nr:hypothetical protein [Parachlamydiaceae bacterium]
MKFNFFYRLFQLSILVVSGAFPIANDSLYAHYVLVGPVPVTTVREIVSFPATTNLIPGSITLGGERDIYVSFPDLNAVRRYSLKGEFLKSYDLPVSYENITSGIAVKWNQDVFVVVNSYFACHHHANGVWKISHEDGSISKFACLPEGCYPSNLVFDKSDHLYLTDSVRGEIYKIDREGHVRSWFRNDVLKGSSKGYILSGVPQGVCAITMGKKSKHLFVANKDFGRIFRIEIKQNGCAGKCKEIANSTCLEGVTELSLNRRGILYAIIPNMNAIVGITDKGIELIYAGSPLESPTGLIMKKHKGVNCGFISNSSPENPGLLRIKVACDPLHAD